MRGSTLAPLSLLLLLALAALPSLPAAQRAATPVRLWGAALPAAPLSVALREDGGAFALLADGQLIGWDAGGRPASDAAVPLPPSPQRALGAGGYLVASGARLVLYPGGTVLWQAPGPLDLVAWGADGRWMAAAGHTMAWQDAGAELPDGWAVWAGGDGFLAALEAGGASPGAVLMRNGKPAGHLAQPPVAAAEDAAGVTLATPHALVRLGGGAGGWSAPLPLPPLAVAATGTGAAAMLAPVSLGVAPSPRLAIWDGRGRRTALASLPAGTRGLVAAGSTTVAWGTSIGGYDGRGLLLWRLKPVSPAVAVDAAGGRLLVGERDGITAYALRP